jgi:uncharacterized membrane protein
MITYVKNTLDKADKQPTVKVVEDKRSEQVSKAAAERHRKSDTDGTRRRARQTVEDNRLL